MRVVIIGGGTAGWLAALFLSAKECEVTLVADEVRGVIGVGESTTAIFSDLLDTHGVDLSEFIRETGSMPKLVKKFVNWDGQGGNFYCPIDGSVTQSQPLDHFSYLLLSTGEDPSMASPCRIQHANGRVGFDELPAFHIDTFRTAEYLKRKCLDKGVRYVDGAVTAVNRSSSGDVVSVVVNGEVLEGDFWFDASGQQRVLSSHIPFVSFKEYLPVNRAISTVIDRKGEYASETTSTALSAGWAWDIPTASKRGVGYVYCSEHISDLEAIDELNALLGTEIEHFKIHSFESGMLERTWNNNVLSIGMCGGFLEPLQATSIHTTVVQLASFINNHLGGYTDAEREHFNDFMSRLVVGFRDLINLSYSGGGLGTPFWRGIKPTPRTASITEASRTRLLLRDDFDRCYGAAGSGVWMSILTGLNHIPPEAAVMITSHNPTWFKDTLAQYQRFKQQEEAKVSTYTKVNDLPIERGQVLFS